MPTLLRIKGYRFFFFSLDWQEPPHVHVESAERYGKFWLDPVMLARSTGFRSGEIKEIREIVKKYRPFFKEKWNEHFKDQI